MMMMTNTNIITEEAIQNYQVYTDTLLNRNNPAKPDPYKDSPFAIFRDLPSKSKGAAFEKIFEECCMNDGMVSVEKPLSPGHDRRVIIKNNNDGTTITTTKKVEIKGSTMWGSSGKFRFSQIRTGQDYDAVVFLFVYPDRIEMHTADKDVVKENLEVQDENGFWIHNQHGGKTVNSGTFWFSCSGPEDVPWLQPFSLCAENIPA